VKRHVNILEDPLRRDAKATFGRFDEIVSGRTGVFPAKRVGETKWFSELTGAHEKTRAVDSPCFFKVHLVVPLGGGLL
jgi:hypothetical protein